MPTQQRVEVEECLVTGLPRLSPPVRSPPRSITTFANRKGTARFGPSSIPVLNSMYSTAAAALEEVDTGLVVTWKNTFVHFPVNSAPCQMRRTHSCPPSRFGEEAREASSKEDSVWDKCCTSGAETFAPLKLKPMTPTEERLSFWKAPAKNEERICSSKDVDMMSQCLTTASSDEEQCSAYSTTSTITTTAGTPCNLMMQNLPCRSTRAEILAEIDSLGFAGRYNYFYQPPNRGQRLSRGYAFIGFATPEVAAEFVAVMHNRPLSCRESTKLVQVLPARIQGLEENMRSFRGTRAAGKAWSPLFLEEDNLNETEGKAEGHAQVQRSDRRRKGGRKY